MRNTKEPIKSDTEILEDAFQRVQRKWKETGDKESWEMMFILVQNCCRAIAKKKANGVGKTVPNLDEKILDATIMVMRDIKEKGREIEKLSSYCYMRVFATMYAKKTQNWEKLVSLEERYEKNNNK